MSDWIGNSRSAHAILGARNYAQNEREVNDYYATEPKAAQLLMEVEQFAPMIWECACGEGHLAKEFERAGYAYQSTGMTRYDNAYHKYEALADALDRDVQKADTRQAAASLKSELIMLASAASRAKLPSAPEGALLALAKEVIAVGRLYGYDGKGD